MRQLAPLAGAVRDISDRLADVLSPYMTGRAPAEAGLPPDYPEMLWWLMKALSFAAQNGVSPVRPAFEAAADESGAVGQLQLGYAPAEHDQVLRTL